MDEKELKGVLEALLMHSNVPLSVTKLRGVFDDWQKPSIETLKKVLASLKNDYNNRAIELKFLASGYCFQTRADYAPWIIKLHEEKPTKYSSAFLETLVIIAYKQPLTRADIEAIRGVAVSSSIIKTMLERGWVQTAGHRDVPGKPVLYVTTKLFLDYFNLQSLEDLPNLPTSIDDA